MATFTQGIQTIDDLLLASQSEAILNDSNTITYLKTYYKKLVEKRANTRNNGSQPEEKCLTKYNHNQVYDLTHNKNLKVKQSKERKIYYPDTSCKGNR